MIGYEEAKITFDAAAVVTAAGGAVGVAIGAWAARRKVLAEAKRTEAEARQMDASSDKAALDAATGMISRLESEVKKLMFRVDSLEEELGVERERSEEQRQKYIAALERIAELEREVGVLRRQVEGTVNQ